MAGEILDAEEVERLLNMMDGDKSPPTQPQFKFEAHQEECTAKRFDKGVMKTLQLMHDRLAHRFAAKISKMLQSVVDVKLATVDQMHYSEFVFGCDNPSCFNLVRLESSRATGSMILDINPVIIYPMIDRMLGGGSEPSMAARRALTNIEWKLAQRIIDEFLYELHVAWQNVVDMECTVAQQESNPQMICVMESDLLVVVLCFDVFLAERRGSVSLCIPVDLLKQLLH